MNDENMTEQEQLTEQLPEEMSGQGGAVVGEQSAPPDTEESGIGPSDAELAEQAAETEKRIAQQEEQDKRLLAALDEALEKRGYKTERNAPKRPLSRAERAAAVVAKKGVGFVSLGLILIFMGIVMIATLTASTPNYTLPIKLSPVCAILIGAEIVATQVMTRGRPRISVPSLLISVLLVAGCIILCLKLGGDYKEEAVEYNNRTIAGEIYDRSYEKLSGLADILSVEVDVDLNPDGTGKTKGIEALSSGDIVNVRIKLGGVYYSPKNFVADCKKVVDTYAEMGINITNFRFKNESRLRSYSLDIDGKYAQDMDEKRLAEMVNYVYIDDYDYIEDMEDYVETSDTSDTSDTSSGTSD